MYTLCWNSTPYQHVFKNEIYVFCFLDFFNNSTLHWACHIVEDENSELFAVFLLCVFSGNELSVYLSEQCLYFPATNCLCIWVNSVCIFRQRIVYVSECTVSVFSGNELSMYLSAQCLHFPATNCLYIWVHGVCIFRQRIVYISECTVCVFSGNELSMYLSARCLYFPACESRGPFLRRFSNTR